MSNEQARTIKLFAVEYLFRSKYSAKQIRCIKTDNSK